MKKIKRHWLKTSTFAGLILAAGPTMAFWFCPPVSSEHSANNASSTAYPSYPMSYKEMRIAPSHLVQIVGLSESKSPMPSPLERSGPGGIKPPVPNSAYPGGTISDIRLEKGSDADNYYLTIYLTGYQPEDIGVSANRGSLMIYSVRSEEHRHQAEGDYRYMKSFRRFSRRISIPPDANLGGLTRTNGASTVEVVVPRMR